MNISDLDDTFAALCRTMSQLTITEASGRSGIDRRTLQRWIKKGRIKKDQQGRVTMEAIREVANQPKDSGRPLKYNPWREFPEFYGQAGLKRLYKMLVQVGNHYQSRGDFESFRLTLAQSLATCSGYRFSARGGK